MATTTENQKVKSRAMFAVTVKFEITWEPATDPDLSLLGGYCDSEPVGHWYIDRHTGILYAGRGNAIADGFSTTADTKQYRYYLTLADNYAGCGKDEIIKYIRQDYELAERYNNDEWCYQALSVKMFVGDLMLAESLPAQFESFISEDDREDMEGLAMDECIRNVMGDHITLSNALINAATLIDGLSSTRQN